MKPVVGLIGGIGSGKSQVAEELKRQGGRVLSGDQFGHEALRQPEIRGQVVRRWGQEMLDETGEIDRRQLGRIVFADPGELRRLEALVFPFIERRFREGIAEAAGDPETAFIVLDAAVMLEAGWNEMCDWIVYVDAPRALRLQRLAEKRGWGPKEVEARERNQLPLTEKESRADVVVDNTGTPEQLAQQVARLLSAWGLGQ